MGLYYERQLEAKIKRQAAEITRLLAENAELKGLNSTICDVCKNDEFLKETAESARAEGQQEAWKLAQNIVCRNSYNLDELREIFGCYRIPDMFEKHTYSEAAAKVAEWKKAKEEICVGDVVECEEHYGVVVGAGEVYVKVFTSDWTPFQWMKKDCTKTGRHIDVNAFLKQIGGEE